MLVSMAITCWRRCSGLLIVVGVGMLAVKGSAASEPADPGNGRSSCGNGQARSQMPRVNLAKHPPYDLDWHDTATSRAVATPVPLWPAGPSGRAARGPGNSAVSSLKDDGWRP